MIRKVAAVPRKYTHFVNFGTLLLLGVASLFCTSCGSQASYQKVNTTDATVSFGTGTDTAANTALSSTSLTILVTCNGQSYPATVITAGKTLPLVQGASCTLALSSFTLSSSQEVFSASTAATAGSTIITGSYRGSLGNTATITPSITAGSLAPVGTGIAVLFAYQSANTVTVAKESSYTYFGVVSGQTGTFQLTFSTTSGSVSNLALATSALPTGFSVSQSTCSTVTTAGTCAVTLTFAPSSTNATVQSLTLPYTYSTDDGISRSSQVVLSYQGLNRLKWSYAAPNKIQSQPLLNAAGTTVYVSSNDGKLYSLDAATGSFNWSYTMVGGPSSPTLSADGTTIFLGSGTGRAAAINASTGAQIWLNAANNCQATSNSLGTPTVSRDSSTVFLPCYNPQEIIAFNASSGATLWNTASIGTVGTSPIVATLDGLYLIINGVFTNMVHKYIIAAPHNAVATSVNTGLELQTIPVLNADGSLVYVGSGSVISSNNLFVFYTSNLTTKWSSVVIGGYMGSSVGPKLSPDETMVYITESDYYVYAFSTNQTAGATNVAWTWRSAATTGTWNATVAVSPNGKTIYAPSSLGISVFNAVDGSVKWTYTTPAALTQMSPLVSADGNTIYFGSFNNSMYALNENVVKY